MSDQPNPYSEPESSELPTVEAKEPTSKRKMLYWIAFGGCVVPLALLGLLTVWQVSFWI